VGSRFGAHPSVWAEAKTAIDNEPMFLRPAEAAALAGLSTRAIYRAIQRGELTAYKPGGRLRIYESDLEAWLHSTKVHAKNPPGARPAHVLPPGTPDRRARRRQVSGSLRARVRANRAKQTAA
jgi:excisionase family DNA binding protein